MRPIRFLPLALTLVLVPACGGGDADRQGVAASETPEPSGSENAAAKTSSAPAAAPKPWDPGAGVARVSGKIAFDGDPPRRRKVDMGSDAQCSDLHEEKPLDESVIVGAGGGLANVFVWVRKGLDAWEFTPPSEPATIDQQGCAYVPHVLGAQVGQPVEIRNSDPITHNVHGYSKKNTGFNQTQAPGSSSISKVFAREEVFVTLKCDIHGWMNTNLAIVEHPFFAVSGEDGGFDLGLLPPGDYQVAARHEVFGLQKQDVTIGPDGAAQNLEFRFTEED
ncbi:MAG: carboxypeptidase regulatory-like domain-containing protein [Planctomycetota bacterium]|jgi:plastocyanin|nr:carboxypeptidase regulatory-like domain-containing protein [Planctomycetota bacterium]MDP6764202.1 carboxypeptidase regulatory-like domain-containing protein [Planctomycetota bacterium]MDP6988291.1 carboxypeptidase regulatory-like domain-containing protein [Planctomycetota bacterium]